ncbi:MAG: hypothetical protein IKN04_07155 [Clostridia bacterium]|nr:hypothetical protein [Clostridia bacterium]
MENIIIAILFTYPGAFAEFVYTYFAKDRDFYKKPEEYFRIARVFFLSAFITLLSLLLIGFMTGRQLTVENAAAFLGKGNNALFYTFISCAISAAIGFTWFAARVGLEKAENRRNTKHGKAMNGPRKQVWMSMMEDPDTPQTGYVIEIRKNGELAQCGLAYHVPDDLREDTGFALMHCGLVKEYMDNPEYDLISAPLVSYIDLDHGAEIIIRDGTKFSKWLAGELK